MNIIFSKSSLGLYSLLIISILIVTSCKDSTKPDPNPPSIPPESTFVLDLSSLTDTSSVPKITMEKLSDNYSIQVGSNWWYAATNVSVLTFAINAYISIPTAAFVATIAQDPEYVGDLRWKWTNNFLGFHTAVLYGEINGPVVNWEMYISRTGGFQDFLWFTGESNIDGSGGTWMLNKSVEEPVEYLSIDWNHYDVGVNDLKYEVVQPSVANFGSYIFYAVDTDVDYNAECTFYNSVDTALVNVEWHRIYRNGRVKSPGFYRDQDWHCWDENLENIDCP